MTMIAVESTTNVSRDSGTCMEQKFDERDQLEREHVHNGNRKQSTAGTLDSGIRIRKRA